MSNLIKGIDISTIQGNVDFKAVAATGVQFVICRCGVGNSGIDTKYKQNITNAKAAGLKVMAYHFVYPLPTTATQPLRDPKAQAKMHADAAGGELAACDLEWPEPQDWSKWGCSATQIVQWTIDYLVAYEELTGIRPLVYTYPNFAQSINLPDWFGEKYKLWLASYASTPLIPKPWTDWVLWQDTGGGGKLPSGAPVDTDKVRDLSLWASPQLPLSPAPVVTPEPSIVVPISNMTPLPQPVQPPLPVANSSIFQAVWDSIRKLFA